MIDTFILVIPLMISPGPANLVSFVLGARNGFSRTLPFQFGIIVLYGIIALGLGYVTTGINLLAPRMMSGLQILGGLFIIFLGVQLAIRNQRNTPDVTPTFTSGALLQALNPKYPGVVLTVFASRPEQPTLVTTLIIMGVGAMGLFSYSLAGAVVHSRGLTGSGFRKLDLVGGVLLCLVGVWFAIQPLLGV